MQYDDVDVDDVSGPDQEGLMRVLNNKQRQIDLLQEKIEKLERNNNRFDKMGKVKKMESIDFEFELDGKNTFV
jgi:TolA-binding protein